MTEPLWHGRHGHGAMGRHKDDLRAEAEERQRVYDAAHQSPAAKLLTEVFTAPDHVPGPTMETVPAEPKRTRRRRNVTRQHKAHTD